MALIISNGVFDIVSVNKQLFLKRLGKIILSSGVFPVSLNAVIKKKKKQWHIMIVNQNRCVSNILFLFG